MKSEYVIDFTISFTGQCVISSRSEEEAIKKFYSNLPVPDNSNINNLGVTHVSKREFGVHAAVAAYNEKKRADAL